MTREAIAPTITPATLGQTSHDVYTHPAYGSVVLTQVQGGGQTLFGSEVHNLGCIRIEVRRTELHRHLARDWIHPNGDTVVVFEMTHAQFAEFIMSTGRSEGTPVTLVRAPTTPAVPMPMIAKPETAHETFRREIQEAAKERLEALAAEVARLNALINEGKTPMKTLRELGANLKRHVEQAPGSIAFVVESAEEALEKATSHARTEVEAFINVRAKSLGFDSLTQLANAGGPDRPVLEDHSKS